MSQTLTANLRDTILLRVMAHRFDAPEAKLKERENKLFDALYEHLIPVAHRRTMESLPEGWLLTTSAITVDPGPAAPGYLICRGEARRKPADFNSTVQIGDLPKRLALRAKTLNESLDALMVQRRELRRECKHLLRSFRTVAALRKGWPEVEPFLDGLDVGKKQLPAILVDEVNKKLGLAA